MKNIPIGIFLCMSKAERTRQQILEATAPILNKKGFEGTSLSDLCHATRLTKGALYGHFESKEVLALEAFRYSVAKVKALARDRVSKGITYREKLSALLQFYAAYVMTPPVEGGCPLLNTAIEADDQPGILRAEVVREIDKTIDFITDLLDQGVEGGEFRKGFQTRDFAVMLFCSIEGAIMVSRASGSRAAMDAVVRFCESRLDEIERSGRKTLTRKKTKRK